MLVICSLNLHRNTEKRSGIGFQVQSSIDFDHNFECGSCDSELIFPDCFLSHPQINPDAKHFHAKFFENYDELCIIVGNDQAIASCSDNGAEIDVDFMSDNEGVESTIVPEIRSDDKQAKNLRWTEEMDCCLGKILVEQMQKGYKIDNLQREAYGIALMALKDKFRPDLSKDHIRNQLKTWRKQYGVLKELLFHTGFKWNAAQKVVVGSDSVWSDYIKTHRDARPFRGRVCENYDHLCFIFGNNYTMGSYSRTADDIVHSLAGDSDGMEEKHASLQTHRDARPFRGRVCENYDHLCIIFGNNYTMGSYSRTADDIVHSLAGDSDGMEAVLALNERFQLGFTKDHVRSRIKTWKKLYGCVKELLDHSEFRWDEKRKMVIADDSVWHDYIKVNPDVRFLRGQIIENYAELCIIIGNDNPIECSVNDAEANLDWSADKEGTRARSSSSSRSKQPSKKRRVSAVIVEMMSCMAANIGRIADALTGFNQSVCLDELFEMVQNIPGFYDNLVIEACELLSLDEKRAKMFLKLDERLRKLWLLKRLRSK
ncbi:hypothetical protein TEA_010974 [Camellia sinensis var. sinensis]|uniref:Myb/SANT-like domain-containing protein n=1 Tax=Camellia sinensis var. sinensis TaxID=542762 RepID=A0A4S4EQX6_CAMSN|nr:hypothetical protein TEA_010974 [Camellia sinensis var. sinensis]